MSFTLVMGILVAAISYAFFYHYNKDNLIQATELNVQFITDNINTQTDDIQSLIRWCQINTRVSDFTLHGDNSNASRLSVYDRLNEQFNANYAQNYIRRIIISNFSNQYLQIVPTTYSTAADIPSIAMSLDYFDAALYSPDYDYSMGIVDDPFMRSEGAMLPLIRPIYHPYNSTITGWIFVELSADVFVDAIQTYSLDSGSRFYLTIGDKVYAYDNGDLILQKEPLWDTEAAEKTLLYTDTTVSASIDDTHTLYVTRPLALEGCYITQSIPSGTLFSQATTVLYVILLLALLVLCAGILFTFYLNHIVNRPVEKLKSRMKEISSGNFEKDPSIEWENEFGDIGRGINDLSANVLQLMNTRLEIENEKRQYEYQMLQSQINPHFLYNTLNSIKWMASIQNATGIPEMTTALSRLLKSIAKDTMQRIPLSKELELLRDYFVIQQYRYGGSITMDIEVESEDLENCEILRFTLQPLVENAIFHGIEPKGAAGTIRIHIYKQSDDIALSAARVIIDITDDGVGMSEDTIAALFAGNTENSSNFFKDIGISNVHKRIQYEYGEAYGLSFQSEPGVYTTATVTLPYTQCQTA